MGLDSGYVWNYPHHFTPYRVPPKPKMFPPWWCEKEDTGFLGSVRKMLLDSKFSMMWDLGSISRTSKALFCQSLWNKEPTKNTVHIYSLRRFHQIVKSQCLDIKKTRNVSRTKPITLGLKPLLLEDANMEVLSDPAPSAPFRERDFQNIWRKNKWFQQV